MKETKPDFNKWDSRDYDVYERKAFWNAVEPWLAGQGYELYKYMPNSWNPDDPPLEEAPSRCYTGVQELPYALLGRAGQEPQFHAISDFPDMDSMDSVHWSFSTEYRHRFRHAQDRQGRHVIVKAVKEGSKEIQIYQRLKANVKLSPEAADFAGIIPVLDILPYKGNFFVVMPRWGEIPVYEAWFKHNYEILDFIHCALKGLVVLHDNRIFHKDLQEGNFLVNYAWSRQSPSDMELHEELGERRKLVYAINDFDLSDIFPLDTSLTKFRLYAYAATNGVWEKPYGVLAGELDFNPFAYDVGCLGIYFCDTYQHLTGDVPFLAPLFDGMVTANIDERLTAREALNFFEEELVNLTNDQLQGVPSEPPKPSVHISWNCYDRWQYLTPGLRTQWAKYHMQKPSWWARQLQSLRQTGPRGVYTVHYLRQFGKYLKTWWTWIVCVVYPNLK